MAQTKTKMRRIADEEIERIKKDTDLIALIQSRGVKLTKQGTNWTGFCPFHHDTKTPNLVVTPSKGLFRCMASCCGKAGNAIQFVQWHDGISFRHAFELLDNGSSAAFENNSPAKKSQRTKLENPLSDKEDNEMLEKVAQFYHSRLASVNGPAAMEYLASRGIANGELVKTFQIGLADRSLGLRIPHSRTVEGAETRKKLAEIGVYRETGREHLNGCLTIPIRDLDGNVVQIYGRRMERRAPKHMRHLYLAKPLAGVFNGMNLGAREIILTESILDALTFWHHGMREVTCTFGTENFTDELFEAVKDWKVESVRLAYDADEAGEKATLKATERLQAIGVECHRIKFPWGSDANQYAKDQGGEALRKAVRDAIWLGAGKTNVNIKKAANLAAEPSASVAKERNQEIDRRSKIEDELQNFGEYWQYELDDRCYRVGGLHKNNGLEVLRITLRVTCEGLMHVDSLDLYRDGERRKFIERASEETRLDKLLLKRDLGKLLLLLESEQESRLSNQGQEESEGNTLDAEDRNKAMEFLRSPDLLERIAKAYDAAGLVGESTNKLAAYLACVSRKLDKPLAVIIQSTSAAGKSTLMEAVLSFFPHEEQIKYSAMTGQSLYYLGEADLKHKILAIVEEEGAEKASYALKLLQSEGELTIASTGKDPQSGRMETQEYHVEGPVSIVFTTTSIDIDEELMNRCLVLTVDESKEQTERIHELQRLARTPEGIITAEQRKEVTKLMQDVQRLIVPKRIANPFAKHLTFTSGRTRTRRDHEKYLTLIDAIALLHQHQREMIEHKLGERTIEMLPVTLEDIAAANRIAPEVLGRSLDELPPQTRRLLDSIKKLMCKKLEANPSYEQSTTFFSRKELREHSGWSEFQVRTHLERLETMEYVFRSQGRQGSRCSYQLLVDCNEGDASWQVGLIDVEKLKQETNK